MIYDEITVPMRIEVADVIHDTEAVVGFRTTHSRRIVDVLWVMNCNGPVLLTPKTKSALEVSISNMLEEV